MLTEFPIRIEFWSKIEIFRMAPNGTKWHRMAPNGIEGLPIENLKNFASPWAIVGQTRLTHIG